MMHIQTDAQTVKIKQTTVGEVNSQKQLFIEVTSLKGEQIAAFSSGLRAADWLRDSGFSYVQGSQAIWSRKKTDGGISSEPVISSLSHSQPDKTPRKFWQRLKDRIESQGWTVLSALTLACVIVWTWIAYKLVTM